MSEEKQLLAELQRLVREYHEKPGNRGKSCFLDILYRTCDEDKEVSDDRG